MGAHFWVRQALAKVFKFCGHNAELWLMDQKSAYDAIDEFTPDLLVIPTYCITKAIYNLIKEHPDMMVIGKASDNGPALKEIDLDKYPLLVASEAEIDTIAKLKEETGKPDFVYVHYHERYLNQTHGWWRDIGVEPVSMMNAADVFAYTNGEVREHYKSDIAYVGGYWSYKSQTLNQYLQPLCHPIGRYNIKIAGNGWGVPQAVGFLPEEEVRHFLASATICPNISEPHSQDFGWDIIERPFKLAANKCFCISDYVSSMVEDVFGDAFVYATSPDEFLQLCEHYTKYPNERLSYIQKAYEGVMKYHTYFDRAAKLMFELGLDSEYNKILEGKEKAMGILNL